MPRLVTRPRAPARFRTTADSQGSARKWWTSQAAAGKPRMMATKVRVRADRCPRTASFPAATPAATRTWTDRRMRCGRPSEKRTRATASTFPKTRRFPGAIAAASTRNRQRQQHHEYFEDLYADGHRPFATAVREESTRHGKQNERQGEQRHDQFAEFMFLGEGHVQPDEQEHDEIFQDRCR